MTWIHHNGKCIQDLTLPGAKQNRIAKDHGDHQYTVPHDNMGRIRECNYQGKHGNHICFCAIRTERPGMLITSAMQDYTMFDQSFQYRTGIYIA